MSDTSEDWGASLRGDAVQRLEAIQRMQDQLASLVGEARSPYGRVEVRVTAAGMPTSLKLSEAALDLSPEDLSAEIMSVLGRATVEVSQRMRAVVGEVVPAEELDAMMSGRPTDSDRRDVQAQLDALRGGGF